MKNRLEFLHTDLLNSKIIYREINLLFLSQVLIGDNFLGAIGSWNFTNILKKIGLENVAKYFLHLISNERLERQTKLHFQYLFIYEVNNLPVSQTLDSVYAKFDGEGIGVLISDARLRNPDHRTINVFEYSSAAILLKSFIHFFGLFPSILRNRKHISLVSRRYNINMSFLILNLYDSILCVNVIDSFLSKVQLDKVIMISDVHKIARIVALRAKKCSLMTYVVQHGATVGEEGYMPIIADKMLVWGEGSKEWFVERGQLISKIEKVGSPRMDKVIYKKFVGDGVVGRGWKKVLVVMSVMNLERGFLMTIRDGILKSGLHSVDITIKLHPGGAIDYGYIPREVFGNSGLSYKIRRFENMRELLVEADIVMVTNSTVGMEAIIENKPVFQFKSSEHFNHRMSYEDFDCSHIFWNAEQLALILTKPGLVFSKIDNYQRFISHYFVALDGNAARRVKEYVTRPTYREFTN